MPTTVAAALRVRVGGSRVSHAVTRKGKAYTLGMTPETSTLDGLAYGVQVIARPGLTPIVRLDAPQLRTLQFSHQVIRNTETTLMSLQALARSGLEVRFIAVSALEGSNWWRIQGLNINISERLPDQTPKTATVTWNLIESVDIAPKIGKTPPPGGMFSTDLQPLPTNDPYASGAPGGSTYNSQVPAAAAPQKYVVKGEKTLYYIAGEVWGDSNLWNYIANANVGKLSWDTRYVTKTPTGQDIGIRFLKPGLVLTIPAKPGQVPTYPLPPNDPGRHQA
jgi:hypothetical protein